MARVILRVDSRVLIRALYPSALRPRRHRPLWSYTRLFLRTRPNPEQRARRAMPRPVRTPRLTTGPGAFLDESMTCDVVCDGPENPEVCTNA